MKVNPDELERGQFTFTDGEEGRMYYHPETGFRAASVTTVLKERNDPDKDEGIGGWKDHFDGSVSYRSPHWEDQMLYKQVRGTLAHYAVLNQLDSTLDMSHEEYEAQDVLQNWVDERPRDDDGNVLSTGSPQKYDGADPWDKAMREVNYVCEAFEGLWNDRDLHVDNVIAAEKFISYTNPQFAYCGQFDLLYEDADGEIVVADLKTSSAVRIDYKLQLAAYANALDRDVDRLEVWRIYPDKEQTEVSRSDTWERSVEGLTHEFLALAERTIVHRMDDDMIDTEETTT